MKAQEFFDREAQALEFIRANQRKLRPLAVSRCPCGRLQPLAAVYQLPDRVVLWHRGYRMTAPESREEAYAQALDATGLVNDEIARAGLEDVQMALDDTDGDLHYAGGRIEMSPRVLPLQMHPEIPESFSRTDVLVSCGCHRSFNVDVDAMHRAAAAFLTTGTSDPVAPEPATARSNFSKRLAEQRGLRTASTVQYFEITE